MDTPQKQLSSACLRPNLSPCCKHVISMNKGRFQTGFARRRATVICLLSPALFSLSTDKPPPVSFCCYSSVSSSHRLPKLLSLLTYKWASGHFRRDSIQLCCPIRAWSIFSSLSGIQPGGGRRLHLAKHVQKELEQNEGEGKKKKKEKRYFSVLPKQNQSTAGTVYRRSVQRHSHLTRGLASCIWHQLPRLDKQCLVGILNHLMQLRAILQSCSAVSWLERHWKSCNANYKSLLQG